MVLDRKIAVPVSTQDTVPTSPPPKNQLPQYNTGPYGTTTFPMLNFKHNTPYQDAGKAVESYFVAIQPGMLRISVSQY